MEHEVWYKYPQAVKKLPEDIYFITSQELEDMYPDKTPKERENLITKEHGCVFLMKIGDKLASGEPHDGRAPDYDDWQLNGDILFWFETLNCALEISSMGIRVDEKSSGRAACKSRLRREKESSISQNAVKTANFRTPSEVVSDSPDCACCFSTAHMSVKYRQVCGRSRCGKPAKNTI